MAGGGGLDSGSNILEQSHRVIPISLLHKDCCHLHVVEGRVGRIGFFVTEVVDGVDFIDGLLRGEAVVVVGVGAEDEVELYKGVVE